MTPVLNVVASGSSGNCYCIETDDKIIFVDAGLAYKKVSGALGAGLAGSKDCCLFITHEHRDHIAGIRPLINKFSPKIYTSEGTAFHLEAQGINTENLYVLDADVEYDFSSFSAKAFKITHDCSQPFGYRFNLGDTVCTFATDLGFAGDYVIRNLEGSTTLVLESNYDEQMLAKGSYPEYLQKRIRSAKGHLSNNDMLKTVADVAGSGVQNLYLAHVSDDNNSYDILDRCAAYIRENYLITSSYFKKGESALGLKI